MYYKYTTSSLSVSSVDGHLGCPTHFWDKIIPGHTSGSGSIKTRLRHSLTFARCLGEGSHPEEYQGPQPHFVCRPWDPKFPPQTSHIICLQYRVALSDGNSFILGFVFWYPQGPDGRGLVIGTLSLISIPQSYHPTGWRALQVES